MTVVGGVAAVALLYQQFTNPEAIRSQLLAQLAQQMPGASISVQSASWRLFGGISVSEMHLARRDDPEHHDFLYIPSAIIYHDKEHLLDGKLQVRKLELDRPRFRIRRSPEGRWNLADLLGPVHLDVHIPTIVITKGTILLEDSQTPGAVPLVLRDVNLTLMNDPVETITFAGAGTCERAGAFSAQGESAGASGDTTLSFKALRIPVGLALLERLAPYVPGLKEQQLCLEGQAQLQVELAYREQPRPVFSHVVTLQLKQGKLRHPQLPLELENLQGLLRCTNNQLSLENCTAHAGPTRLELSFKDFVYNASQPWEETVRKLDLKLEHLVVNEQLFRPLPDDLRELYDDFGPAGPVTLTLSQQREEGLKWRRRCVIPRRTAGRSHGNSPTLSSTSPAPCSKRRIAMARPACGSTSPAPPMAGPSPFRARSWASGRATAWTSRSRAPTSPWMRTWRRP